MSKWRDKNEAKLEEICKKHNYPFENVMTKEKYARFDCSPNGGATNEFLEDLWSLEAESEHMCQTCARTSRQFWITSGRFVHYCWYHYIIEKIKRFFKRLYYKCC